MLNSVKINKLAGLNILIFDFMMNFFLLFFLFLFVYWLFLGIFRYFPYDKRKILDKCYSGKFISVTKIRAVKYI